MKNIKCKRSNECECASAFAKVHLGLSRTIYTFPQIFVQNNVTNHIHFFKLETWQLLSITLDLNSKVGWKWKWSNGAGKRKSEMSIIWCISITNNVKSCKKINETAQTANFTDLPLNFCGNGPKWTKTMETQMLSRIEASYKPSEFLGFRTRWNRNSGLIWDLVIYLQIYLKKRSWKYVITHL